MKRITKVLVVTLIVAAFAVPAMAWGPRWGGGHHMWGDWNRGYGNTLTNEQREQMDKLARDYYKETDKIRNDLWSKSNELSIKLNSENPDLGEVKALQKEISNLRATLDEKKIAYDLEARNISPDSRLGYGYGPGYHMGGYGGHMMGYGAYRGGYGPGTCWN